MMKISDETLVERCLKGDRNAFGQLVSKYQNAVYGLCFHMVGNFADAQDLAQEAFVKAYLELPRMRDYSRFASWLHRIAANLCRMWLRDRKGADDIPLEAVARTAREFADDGSQHEHAEAEELRLSIKEAIASLPERNRLAMTLYYIDGLSYEEIGDFLSVTESAVKSRLHRARKQLREELIAMVEDGFDKHKLPEDFPEKVVQEMVVGQMLMDTDANAPVLILQNKDDKERILPIWIGVFEAIAICQGMAGSSRLSRPMTHDLMANMLEELGARIVRVVVTDLKESTFYARIAIQIDGALKEVDARPSDSIALALRAGVPIFVAKSVLSESGVCSSDEFLKSRKLEAFDTGKLSVTKPGAIKVGTRFKSLFQIDPKFEKGLSSGKISDELRQELEDNGISLSSGAVASQTSANAWQIKDEDRIYLAIKREDKLEFCSAIDSSEDEDK